MIPKLMLKSLKREQVSGSLTTVTANVVKIICIELDVLTWLMANSFVASVLILVSNISWRDVVSTSKYVRFTGCVSEGCH